MGHWTGWTRQVLGAGLLLCGCTPEDEIQDASSAADSSAANSDASADGAAGGGGLVDAAGSDGGGLRWYLTCGDPVCSNEPAASDDPNVANCTGEKSGDVCTGEGKLCDGVASCGQSLICAKTDPTMAPGGCPRSRARFKDGISYLTEQELNRYHEQLMSMPLASYQYKHEKGAGPQLGFIIEDIEPSVAVSGDHVNLYGYLSMAVAAIKVQQAQIKELQRELSELRRQQRSRSRAAR